MSSITLTPYQKTAISNIINALDNYRSPQLAVLPTGSGKSIIIREVINLLPQDRKILILQPNIEILDQNYQRYIDIAKDESVSKYSDSAKQKKLSRVVFATIGSIYKKVEIFKQYQYLVIDETHLVNPEEDTMYAKFINYVKPKIIGLTATPYRLDKQSKLRMITAQENSMFNDICYNVNIKSLINNGYLSNIKYNAVYQADLDNFLLLSQGDYNKDLVNRYYLAKDLVLQEICEFAIQNTKDRLHGIIVCSTIEMQVKITEKLNSILNKTASFVNSKHSKEERNSIIKDFKEGKYKFLCVVGICTLGFDFPALDLIIDLCPTYSLSKYIQTMGRILRKSPNKDYGLIIDFANNINRFGTIDNIYIDRNSMLKNNPYDVYGIINGKTTSLTTPYLHQLS